VPAAIEIDGLRVVRGGRAVLHDVTLAVDAGTVTGLLGPSGSGKTTLMRAVVGVQRVAAGSVRVLGLSAGAPALRRRVGYMTQAPSVYADLTAAENLRYFARILDVPAARVDEVLGTVELGALAGRVVARLSGGEQARVSLATALLAEPELLVLDEPTVGLDPVLRHELWTTFRALAGSGTTLLVSSHVMDEAARCDSLVLLREGRVLARSTPAELLASTGRDELDAAFLALVEGDERAAR
jgi:ABC-2 type transport system ATP-binding protein